MPVNPDSFEYRFSVDGLIQIRKELGLSQAKLAQRLNLPVNTISRWEREETTPDVDSLAAYYSIAKEGDLNPQFFQRRTSMAGGKMNPVESEFMDYLIGLNRKPVEMTDLGQRFRAIMEMHDTKPKQIGLSKNHPAKSILSQLKEQNKVRVDETHGGKNRVSVEVLVHSRKRDEKTAATQSASPKSRSIVMCDLQNLGVRDNHAEKFDKWIREQVEQKAPGLRILFRAFCGSQQESASDKLSKLGWRSKSQRSNADQAIINDAKSYCGEKPGATVLFLVTKDGDFKELVSSLKQKGATVFLIAPEQGTNQSLVQAVGKKNWIKMPVKW